MAGYTHLGSIRMGQPVDMSSGGSLDRPLTVTDILYVGPGWMGRPHLLAETPLGQVGFYGITATAYSSTHVRSLREGDFLYRFLYTQTVPDGPDLHHYKRISLAQVVDHIGYSDLAVSNNDYGTGGTELALRDVLGRTPIDLMAPGGHWALSGSRLADVLFLDEGGGTVIADAGDDDIYGADGLDEVWGGDGWDYVDAGGGADTVFAGGGVDIVRGGPGDDELHSDGVWEEGAPPTRPERIFGGLGSDHLYGNAHADFLNGQQHDDFLTGREGSDTLFGGAGGDRLVGGPGSDKLNGGPAGDFLYAGQIEGLAPDFHERGVNTLIGGAGPDALHAWTPNAPADILRGGRGRDDFFVDDGDVVQDFQRGDTLHLLFGTDLNEIVSEFSDRRTRLKFLDADLNPLAEITLEGRLQVRDFTVTPASEDDYSYAQITYGGSDGPPVDPVDAGMLFYEAVETLRANAVTPETYKLVTSAFISHVGDLFEQVYRETLGEFHHVGGRVAQRMNKVMTGLASTVGEHYAGAYDDDSPAEIALKYVSATALDVIGAKYKGLAFVLSAVSIIGDEVVKRIIDRYFGVLEADLNADIERIETSILFDRDLIGGPDADEIRGTSEGDRIEGRGRADTLYGLGGPDIIEGGNGPDWIEGGPGHDRLIGGRGRDSFVFDASDRGVDRVVDFVPGVDRLLFRDQHEDDIDIDSYRGGTRVDHAGGRVLLPGVSPEALAEDIAFF